MSSETRPIRRPGFGAWLLITTLVALLMFAYRYLEELANAEPGQFARHLIEEGTGVFIAGLLFLLIRHVARRFPLSRDSWWRAIPVHLATLLLFGATSTSLMWATRTFFYWLFGLGTYDYGLMRVRYFMELPLQTIGYTLMVSGVWLFDRAQAEREAALHAAQLESQLRQAQLHGLRLQLQPHFLFNALNTISSTMYDDPRAADTMIARLAELLRVSLRTTQTQEVSLAAELDALDHYVALLRARFGDRLRIAIAVDEEALREALVPSLVLQPLVENAVRHGNLSRLGEGRIDVRARRDGDRLRLTVEDDGPGPDPHAPVVRDGVAVGHAAGNTAGLADRVSARGASSSAPSGASGVGLHATRERLRLLHGDAASLTLRTAPDRRAFSVEIALPLRSATHDRHGSTPAAAARAVDKSLPSPAPPAAVDTVAPAARGSV